jgi:hypothetical protein
MNTVSCSNCAATFSPLNTNAIQITEGSDNSSPAPIAGLCPECVGGAQTIHLTIERKGSGYVYSQVRFVDKAFGK